MFPQTDATQQEQKNIQQVQASHRLETGQGLKTPGNRQQQGGSEPDQFVEDQCPTEQRESVPLLATGPMGEPAEDGNRGENAQPLEPSPAQQVIVTVRLRHLMVSARGGLKNGSPGQQRRENLSGTGQLPWRNQEKTIRDGEHRHQGMHDRRENQKQSRLQVPSLEHPYHGKNRGKRHQISRVHVLIHDVQRRSCHGQGQ